MCRKEWVGLGKQREDIWLGKKVKKSAKAKPSL
jgi:hypothetical protein